MIDLLNEKLNEMLPLPLSQRRLPKSEQIDGMIAAHELPLLAGAKVSYDCNNIAQLQLNLDHQQALFASHHSFTMGDIIPATVLLEYLLEAAAWLLGHHFGQQQCYPLAVSQFIIERGLVLTPGKTTELEIHIEKIAINSVKSSLKVSLLSQRINRQGKCLGKKRHASAQISFDFRLKPSVQLPYFDGEIQQYKACKDFLYDRIITTHGPLFQSLTGEFVLSENRQELLGEYHCQHKEKGWLASGNDHFIMSPLGLDSCLQLICFSAILHDGKPRLPMKIQALQVFRQHPSHSFCRVHIHLQRADEAEIICKMAVFDSNNQVILEAQGVMMRHHMGQQFDAEIIEQWLARSAVTATPATDTEALVKAELEASDE
ncbi:polyketide synthase dehydratase domain-containing protein [Motilimonas pumila]|uniref:PKS/mFAS DH domain-containing protein n=1 Tax=Motilimonas pumila TaxID=2303987 RepID=A0A418YIF5_9GAMM|nr:polyketide synthase dehydratase domain-containing protein [Motilimonas pumila]RJG50435.1 hypothetical protein D1Z90_02855 [Motilimonas pumila]